MSDTPDYQSVLDHMRARREQLDAAIVAMEAMVGFGPAAPVRKAQKPKAPPSAPAVTGLSPRPLDALTESAIRTALKQGADTVSSVAAVVKLHPEIVKRSLRAMRESGAVVKTGATQSTRYHLS